MGLNFSSESSTARTTQNKVVNLTLPRDHQKQPKIYERPHFLEEDQEFYRPGGFHPINLNDVVADRFKVSRKLGFGANSTVWLARDIDNSSRHFVALKVTKPVTYITDKEADILKYLKAKGQPSHPGASHILQLKAEFRASGPNGEHPVLVFEPTGRAVGQFFNAYDAYDPPTDSYHAFMKEICRQMVLAVDYIHTSGLVHGDIQPGNLLFALPSSLDSTSEEDILRDVPESAKLGHRLTRIDKRDIDEHCPKYIVQSAPLDDGYDNNNPQLPVRVLLSDFQTAHLTTETEVDDQYPLALAPPESHLDLPISQKSDIWAIGTTTFFLMLRKDLFGGWWKDKNGVSGEIYLPSFVEKLGPCPPYLRALWPDHENYLDADGNLLEIVLDDEPLLPLHEDILECKDETMSDAEAALVESFVRKALQYQPERRPSTQELLKHPFFQH